MQGWTRVTIKRSTDDASRWKLLQDSFAQVLMVAGGPAGAAMYSARDMIGKGLTFYFSPAATKLFASGIQLHHGEPSNMPAADDVSLLVGNASAIDPASL